MGKKESAGSHLLPIRYHLFFFLAADKEYYYFLYLEYGHSETTDPLKRYVIDKTGLELKDNDNPAVIKVKFKI